MKTKSNDRVIYTVITGGYDHLMPPLQDQPGWDFVCFTDSSGLESDFWQVRPLPALPELKGLGDDRVRAARLVKILPHRFLGEYDYSLYVDGDRVLYGDMAAYVEAHKQARLLCLGSRLADAYAAAEELLERLKGEDRTELAPVPPLAEAEKEKLRAQMLQWEKEGLPEDGGCPGTAVMGRRHNDETVQAVMETWARQVLKGCSADEPALPYACHKHGLEWTEGAPQVPAEWVLTTPAEQLAVKIPHAALLAGGKALVPQNYPPNPPPAGGEYEGHPLLLTIGVPVSNQIGTIRRCLEGIKPLLDNLPAELVVVDTGSTDGTVEVCKEFGARVVNFPWVNDMSAARNQGIQAAKGLWYMSIDDDEWFEDVDPILFFFESGQYKKYNLAAYYQRNYSVEGTSYSDYPALRLGRRAPDLHFEGRIHDLLTINRPEEVKSVAIKAYANHFGFSFERTSEKVNKSVRNMQSLRLDLAQYPLEGRFAFQMIVELEILRQYGQAYRIGIFGIAMCRAAKTENEKKMAMDLKKRLLVHTMKVCVDGRDDRLALQLYARHANMEQLPLFSRCAVAVFCTNANYRQKNYRQSWEWGTNYLKWRREFMALPEDRQLTARGEITINAVSDDVFEGQMIRHLANAWLVGKRSMAREMLKSPQLQESYNHTTYKLFITNTLCEHKEWPTLCPLLELFIAAEDDLTAQYLLANINRYAEAGDLETLRPFMEPAFAKWPGYADLFCLRQARPGTKGLAQLYENAVAFVKQVRFEAGYELKISLLKEAFRLGLEVDKTIEVMDIFAIDYLRAKLAEPDLQTIGLYKYLEGWYEAVDATRPLAVQYLALGMNMAVLSAAKRGRGEERYAGLFEAYVGRQLDWWRMFYRPEALEQGGSEWVSGNVQAVCAANQALGYLRQENYLEGMRALKTTIEKSSDMKDAVELLRDQVMQQYEQRQQKQAAPNAEFEMLMAGVKQRIGQMLDAGMAAEAVPLLIQLEKLAPGDADLPKLKAQAGMTPAN